MKNRENVTRKNIKEKGARNNENFFPFNTPTLLLTDSHLLKYIISFYTFFCTISFLIYSVIS